MGRTAVRLAALPALVPLLLAAGCTGDKVKTTSDTKVETTTTTVATTTSSTPEDSAPASTSSTRKGGATTTTKGSGATTTSKAGSGGGGSVSLGTSGVTGASFGTAQDSAVAALTKSLGAPTRDVKSPGAECPGPDRLVVWGRLSITMVGGKVAGWSYADSPAGPPHLTTSSGITTGSTVAKLKAAYGADLVLDDGGDGPFGPTFSLKSTTAYGGFLSSTADTGKVKELFAGTTCGE